MKTPDRRALRRIELKNLLSFGPDSPALELENLNILIGPNGSGKSNLIEAISLLRSTPMSSASKMDTRAVVRRGGGAAEWIWRGGESGGALLSAEIASTLHDQPMSHVIGFDSDTQGFRLETEIIQVGNLLPTLHSDSPEKDGMSVLSAIRDPHHYPEYAHLTEFYEKICIYREWHFGRKTIMREPQQADGPNERLDEDLSNVSLVLSRLSKSPKVRRKIVENLGDLYEGVSELKIHAEGGTVQIFFEEGDLSVSTRRLSDGTLHYLCLLAILCDPSPPPLICIEEPELGLHPDVIPKLADLLVEASERTQLIVTTHSDVLVDAMTERPEAVVVCEKQQGQTHMRRLTKDELAPWLEKYRLGELWSRGGIGANRW